MALRKSVARDLLYRAADEIPVYDARGVSILFDDKIEAGYGSIDIFADSDVEVKIGTENVFSTRGIDFPFSTVDDLLFTRTLVALYHEYGHYSQHYDGRPNPDFMIAELSTLGNTKYYHGWWNKLSYEIEAESTGIAMAWDTLGFYFPDKADEMMLAYVNFRANDTMYMIPSKPDGYASRSEIVDAFDEAARASLEDFRDIRGGFFCGQDESTRLLMQGCSRFIDSPNAYHANMLTNRLKGSQKDKMLASLVLQLHPEYLVYYPGVSCDDLSVKATFGRDLMVDTLPDDNNQQQWHRGRDMRDVDAALDGIDHSGRDSDDLSL